MFRWQHSNNNGRVDFRRPSGPPPPPPAVIINNQRISSHGPRYSDEMDQRVPGRVIGHTHFAEDDYDGYGQPWLTSQPPIIINNRIYQHSGESDYTDSDDESVEVTVRRTVRDSGWDGRRHHHEDTRATNHQTNTRTHYSSSDESVDVTYRGYRESVKQPYNTRPGRGENKHQARRDEDTNHSNKSTNFFVDPTRPQDITVHLSLPVQDDLEDLLEECSKLRRLGHFHEALELFQDQLEHFYDNRYVLLQYGQCLLEAGQHAQLETLANNHWPSRPQDLLQLGWDMLLHTAHLGAQEIIDGRAKACEAAMSLLRQRWPRLDSTEAQMLAHVVMDCKTEDQCKSLGDWNDLYQHFIDQGMIWEFRDIFQELLFSFGLDTAIDLIKLYIDLEKGNQDESTLFALLDIFTTIALKTSQLSDQDETTRWCMELAGKQVFKLADQNPDYPMSRPYLRWSVAQILIKESGYKRFEDDMVFRGLKRGDMLFPTAAFPFANLPVYSPADDEVPRWEPKSISSTSDSDNAMIRTVLQAAEELGDLDMQVGCLQELMYRGERPAEKVVDSLADIWSCTGQFDALKMLHLFQYMLAHTNSARRQLRRDILCDGEPAGPKLRLAQCMILRALAPTSREKEHHWAQAKRVQREYHRVRFEKNWNDINSRQGSKDDIAEARQRQRYSVTDRRRADHEQHRSSKFWQDEKERWELERAREELSERRLSKERRELERAREQVRAMQLSNERKQTLRNQERLEEALALASLNQTSAERQDVAGIDRRLDVIKREVEGIEGDIRRAQQTNDTKRIDSLHHRMEELGLERFGLEQTKMRSEHSRVRRNSTWPTDTDGLSLDEGNGAKYERQENTGNETETLDTTETDIPWPQTSEPLLLEYPGYGKAEAGDKERRDGSL
ncbi:hypothetical protein B0T21DRAFT_352885 [Apiosordaria backusii]|uniref:Uncharacterized protein n=1 Tax=Apiosordaria backusii TaxID=314023 RepID=A0AA40A411_9PEZI|nr:hypothetical protein B0T21DRAFT_352885 [Apiosordaria backusii]